MVKRSMLLLAALAMLGSLAAPAAADARPGYHHGGNRHGNWNGRRYYHPPGIAYRRWNNGQFLPRAYWGNNYWRINSYNVYRLAPPRRGFRWVRVGGDALLVNTRNGNIRSVRHGIFR